MEPDDFARHRIAYVPYFDATVEKGYTLRMREALGAFGTVVRYEGIAATWRAHRRRLDAIVLNWTDNDLLDRRTRRVAARKIVKLFAKTLVLRLAARRLVFVRHNVYPHAVAAGHEGTAERWVDRYERLFDAVLTHSGDETRRARRTARSPSRTYCPHPLYRRVRPSVDAPLLRELPPRYFVVFGRIVRYKRIERLVDMLPPAHALVVIGAVGDPAYADELAASMPAHVLFRPGRIAEADAQAIVAGSAALLITHADADTIVSSSFFFAMSLGVGVVAVETPFLRWIAPRVGASLLRTAPDLHALIALLDGPVVAGDPVATRAAIEREFGDDAVRRALRVALGPHEWDAV